MYRSTTGGSVAGMPVSIIGAVEHHGRNYMESNLRRFARIESGGLPSQQAAPYANWYANCVPFTPVRWRPSRVLTC